MFTPPLNILHCIGDVADHPQLPGIVFRKSADGADHLSRGMESKDEARRRLVSLLARAGCRVVANSVARNFLDAAVFGLKRMAATTG